MRTTLCAFCACLMSLAIALTTSQALGGNANEPLPSSRGLSEGESLEVVEAAGYKLTHWAPCRSRIEIDPGYSLCEIPSRAVSSTAFNILRDILNAKVDSEQALCVIDAALVRTQDGCSSPPDKSDVFTLAALMGLLAGNWAEQGVVDRANQLYERAYALMRETGKDNLATINILRDWAVLKLKMGQIERARELAEIEVQLARQSYEENKSWGDSPALLVASLKFQAEILERLGRLGDAESKRKEAAQLTALPNKCIGGCSEPMPE